MNKYNFDRAGFEVSREGRRGCTSCASREIKGSYGETLNRSATPSRQPACNPGGCGKDVNSRYGLKDRAVGSVYAPLQNFDDLYAPDCALRQGTLFRELDLPFHGGTMTEVKRGGTHPFHDLQQIDFVINDATLYLDVYPECDAAREYLEGMREKRAALAKEHESKHGMLTMYGVCGQSSDKVSPQPWEYAAN